MAGIVRRKNFDDILYEEFGRLFVLTWEEEGYKIFYWCACRCGQIVRIIRGHLINDITESCGCLQKEIAAKITKKRSTTHGMTKTKEYKAWRSAKERCYNINNPFYKDYGARGITMCKRWRNSFEKFYEEVGPCPIGMTLERLNNNKGYKPGNCEWETRLHQANNRRSNHFIIYGNQRLTMAQWAKKEKISYVALYHRVSKGQDGAEALAILILKRGEI
jgi:hypothetical protein